MPFRIVEPGEGVEPIRVMIRAEDLDDVKAHGYKFNGLGQTEDDTEGQGIRGNYLLPDDTEPVEGQVYILRVGRPGDQVNDTEGQGYKAGVLGQTEDDVEGQGYRNWLRPAEPDEVEGQGTRAGWLKPDDAGQWTLELDEDVEGQGGRYSG